MTLTEIIENKIAEATWTTAETGPMTTYQGKAGEVVYHLAERGDVADGAAVVGSTIIHLTPDLVKKALAAAKEKKA